MLLLGVREDFFEVGDYLRSDNLPGPVGDERNFYNDPDFSLRTFYDKIPAQFISERLES